VEDGDDKIRRNLLVVSSAVLVVAWLKLPPGELAERIIGIKASTGDVVAGWRVWSAILALLVYLALRYRFHNPTRSAYDKLGERWYQARAEVGCLMVSRSVEAFLNGRSSHCIISIPDTFSVDPVDEVDHDAVPTYVARAESGDNWFTGRVVIDQHFISAVKRVEYTPYELPRAQRWVASLRAGSKLLAYSPNSVEFVVPAVVAYAAIWVSVNRLTVELLR
jgi:hypothetical protein